MNKHLPVIVVLLNLLYSGLGIPLHATEYCECIQMCEYEFTGSCCCEWGVEDYPTDNLAEYLILDAYRLPSSLEQSYKSSDGVLSPFWSAWSDSSYDRVILESGYDGNAYHFTNKKPENISRMEAIAAYGDYGVYLCFVVTDDHFSDTNSILKDRWKHDAVDFCLDRHSSVTHKIAPNLFPNLNSGRIPRDMIQLQQVFGVNEAPDVLSRNFVVDTGAIPKVVYERDLSPSELKSRFGITRDVVILDENRRAQEWFIPYEQIGNNGGISFPMPSSEHLSKVAFSFGYNDVDHAAEADGYDPLRWRNASGPFKKVRKYNADMPHHEPNHVPAEPWGDIRFVEDKVEVKYTAGKPIIRKALKGIPTERFDLRGRKMPEISTGTSRGAVLLRRKLPDGGELVERALHGM